MRNKSNGLVMKKSENHGEKHRLGEGAVEQRGLCAFRLWKGC